MVRKAKKGGISLFSTKNEFRETSAREKQLKLRVHYHRFTYGLCVFWTWFIIEQILLNYQLLGSGTWSRFVYLLIVHRQMTANQTLATTIIGIYIAALIRLSFEIRTVFGEFFDIRAFSRLYTVCPSLDLLEKKSRYPVQSELTPSTVTYTFVDSSLIIRKAVGGSAPLTETATGKTPLSLTVQDTSGEEDASSSLIETLPPPVEQEALLPSPRAEAHVSLRPVLVIDIQQSATVSLEDAERTICLPAVITSKKLLALLVVLGIQQGKMIGHKELAHMLWGDESKYPLIRKYAQRIRKHLNDAAAAAHIPLAEPLDPFVRQDHGKDDSRWGLSDLCQVTGFEDLSRWYQEFKEARPGAGVSKSIALDILREVSTTVRECYSGNYLTKQANEDAYRGGYLIDYLDEDIYMDWAPAFYQQCRSMFLHVLQAIARHELFLAEHMKDARCIFRAISLYKECAYAATCVIIDSKQGEDALRKGIQAYLRLDKKEEAQAFCDTYAKRVKRVQSAWEPEKQTKALLHKHWIDLEE